MRLHLARLFMMTAALSAPAGALAAAPSACSLLTRELLLESAPAESRKGLELSLKGPKQEDEVPAGTGCSWGNVTVMVDAFPNPAAIEKILAKDHERVKGVGDMAYFRDNRGRFAELYVRSGGHVITVQMNVPTGSTAAAVQPHAAALAKALLAKLE